jgi:hypothetical protein
MPATPRCLGRRRAAEPFRDLRDRQALGLAEVAGERHRPPPLEDAVIPAHRFAGRHAREVSPPASIVLGCRGPGEHERRRCVGCGAAQVLLRDAGRLSGVMIGEESSAFPIAPTCSLGR